MKKKIALIGLLFMIAFSSAGVGPAQAQPSMGEPPFSGCDNPDDQSDMPKAECLALVALYDGTSGPSWYTDTGWKFTDTPCFWYRVTCSSGHVISLDLTNNNLVGSIPAKLGKLSNLETLWLGFNSLTGSIPSELGNLSNLERLSLDSNSLTGSIPSDLGNLSNLERLEINVNSLSGKIPKQLGKLSDLTRLRLENNSLTGSIPLQLGNLSNLEILNLDNNNLSGIVPTEMGNLTNLSDLRLHSNTALAGWLPSSLTNLSLNIFYFNGTLLCERTDGAFQAWLGTISSLNSTGTPCNDILTEGFESGDFSAWNLANTGGGDLTVCTKAAINGSYGMCVKNKTNNTKYVADTGMNNPWLSVQFNLDPNGLDLQNKKKVRILQTKDGSRTTHWLELRKKNGKFQVRALANLDGTGKVKTKWQKIANKPRLIEVEWMAATGWGLNDGYLSLYINDKLKQAKSSLDTDSYVVDVLRLGFTKSPAGFSVSGVFFIDDFVSSNTGYIGK